MIKSKIKEAIENHWSTMIKYRNSKGSVSVHHLCNLKYQTKELVLAYSERWKKELSFKIDRIQDICKWWRELDEREDYALENGVYVFACAGDNHLVYEMYQLQKGDNLRKYFTGDFAHNDGWHLVIPLAYHLIPLYQLDYCCENWDTSINDTDIVKHVCVFSYQRNGITEYGFTSNGYKYPAQLKLLYDDKYWNNRESYFDNVKINGVHWVLPYIMYESIEWYVKYCVLLNN